MRHGKSQPSHPLRRLRLYRVAENHIHVPFGIPRGVKAGSSGDDAHQRLYSG